MKRTRTCINKKSCALALAESGPLIRALVGSPKASLQGPKYTSRARPIRRLPLGGRCKPRPGNVTELVGWRVRV